MESTNLSIYVIADSEQYGRVLLERVEQALEYGAKVVQLRARYETGKLYQLGKTLRYLTRQYKAQYFVNDRFDIALATDADGLHLKSQSLPAEIVKKYWKAPKVLGKSVHNVEEGIQAAKEGYDYLILGPIFSTPSKDDIIEPLGVDVIRQLKKGTDVPLLAIGGVNKDNAKSALEAGANGIAAIRAYLDDDAEENIKFIKNLLSK